MPSFPFEKPTCCWCKKRYYIGHGAIKTTHLTQLFWIRKQFFFRPFHIKVCKKSFAISRHCNALLYINLEREVNTPFLIENGNEFFFAKTFETNFLAANFAKKLRKKSAKLIIPSPISAIMLHCYFYTPLSLKFWTSFWNCEFKKIE